MYKIAINKEILKSYVQTIITFPLNFEILTKLIFEYRKNTTLAKIREITLIQIFVCFQRNRNTT